MCRKYGPKIVDYVHIKPQYQLLRTQLFENEWVNNNYPHKREKADDRRHRKICTKIDISQGNNELKG
jgi:hypothetical protein